MNINTKTTRTMDYQPQPLRVCLVEWILGRMEKRKKKKEKKKENGERKLFGECLVERGREENDDGIHVFSLQADQ